MKFLHCAVAFGSNNNSGDNLLYGLVRKMFEINIDKTIQWETISQWDVHSSLMLNKHSSDLIVFGGGGLFLPDQKGASSINKTYWQIDLSCSDHKSIVSPYIACSVGYNWFRYSSVNPFLIEENARSFIQNSLYFSCRNYGSIYKLQTITRLPHGAFKWLPCPTTLIDQCLSVHDKIQSLSPNALRVCAINLPGDRLHQRLSNHNSYSHIRFLFDTVRDNDYSLVFLAHKNVDLEILDHFPSHYFDNIVNLSHCSFKEIISFYKSFDLVLGGRGHSLMIPVGLSVPIISLTTHDKQKFFMEDLGLASFSLEVDSLNYAALKSQISQCLLNISRQLPKYNIYKSRGIQAWRDLGAIITSTIY